MFERFDERARLVVVHAQEEARGLRHAEMDAEHLLLGVCTVDPDLVGVGVHLLRGEVIARVGSGATDPPQGMPLTPAARRVLELSAEHAADRRDPEIRPGHVLLALLDDHAVRELLGCFGRTAEAMRMSVDAVLRDSPAVVPADPCEALEQGHPVAVTLGSGMPLGDLGHPNTDRRLLEAMLVAGGPAGKLLRDHGIDERELRELRRR